MKNQRQNLAGVYMWLVVAVGAAVCFYAALTLPPNRIDGYFLLLAIVTAAIGSRIAIRIPQVNVNITVEDTFVFIALLHYGGEAGVMVGALAGVCSALRISRKVRTVGFGGGALACAVFATATVLKLIFGSTTAPLKADVGITIAALCLMGLVQYFVHTMIGAAATAFKTGETIWQMWTRNFLSISISYFSGAAGSGRIVSSMGISRIWALLICIPIIIIVYYSYDRYMREVKASARYAEEAERRRAEQAERHVQELNNYIAEQERISRVLEETKEHFRHAAFHDSLTGLPNRGLFTQLLQAEIESSKQKSDYMFAVLFLDLDRFKNINDSLGHTHGDLLLVAFAERLERALRPVDTLARFGGDEFAIL